MKHHYAIESCTQETLYYYYAVGMKVNGLKCSRSQTSGNSWQSSHWSSTTRSILSFVFSYSLDKERGDVDVCTFRKNNAIFMTNSLKFIIKHRVISYSSRCGNPSWCNEKSRCWQDALSILKIKYKRVFSNINPFLVCIPKLVILVVCIAMWHVMY